MRPNELIQLHQAPPTVQCWWLGLSVQGACWGRETGLAQFQLLTGQSALRPFTTSASPWIPALVLESGLAVSAAPEAWASAMPLRSGPEPSYDQHHITVLTPTLELHLFPATASPLTGTRCSRHISRCKHSATQRSLG